MDLAEEQREVFLLIPGADGHGRAENLENRGAPDLPECVAGYLSQKVR
jgi:hypothetical protein